LSRHNFIKDKITDGIRSNLTDPPSYARLNSLLATYSETIKRSLWLSVWNNPYENFWSLETYASILLQLCTPSLPLRWWLFSTSLGSCAKGYFPTVSTERLFIKWNASVPG